MSEFVLSLNVKDKVKAVVQVCWRNLAKSQEMRVVGPLRFETIKFDI